MWKCKHQNKLTLFREFPNIHNVKISPALPPMRRPLWGSPPLASRNFLPKLPILQGCLSKLTHPRSPRVASDLSYVTPRWEPNWTLTWLQAMFGYRLAPFHHFPMSVSHKYSIVQFGSFVQFWGGGGSKTPFLGQTWVMNIMSIQGIHQKRCFGDRLAQFQHFPMSVSHKYSIVQFGSFVQFWGGVGGSKTPFLGQTQYPFNNSHFVWGSVFSNILVLSSSLQHFSKPEFIQNYVILEAMISEFVPYTARF